MAAIFVPAFTDTGILLAGAASASAAFALVRPQDLANTASPSFAGATVAGTIIFGSASARMSASTDGVVSLANAAGTSFARLCLGPATSSFPAIRNNGSAINFVKADESTFCDLVANSMTINGSLSVPNSPLASSVNVAGTTGVQTAITVTATSNGNPAATFGTRLAIQAHSASRTVRVMGAIDGVWTTATDASRTADMVFSVVNNTTTVERMRLRSDGTLVTTNAIIYQTFTASTLPSASALGSGTTVFVTDANSQTFNAVVAGGGSYKLPVHSDGTNWLIG